jgi:hypothetical protein
MFADFSYASQVREIHVWNNGRPSLAAEVQI